MHYPPLADGTFRYGDPPRPLPSPVPGPDPEPDPASGPAGPPVGPAAGVPPPGSSPAGAPPPPAATTGGERTPGARAAVAIIVGLGLVAVTAFGLAVFGPDDGPTADPARGPLLAPGAPAPVPERSPGAAEFAVDGSFVVTTSPGEPVSGDDHGCAVPPTLTDIGTGTVIRLVDATRTELGSARLDYSHGDGMSCTFAFGFESVPAGEPYYLVEIPGRGQLVYTERELREGVDITLGR